MSRKKELAFQTENSIFATRLRETMEKRGLSQTALAAKITEKYGTIQRQSISQYMSGQSKPDTERLAAICKALGVSADYLLGISDKTNPLPTIQSAAKITGLSEAAICTLALSNLSPYLVADFENYKKYDDYPVINSLAAEGLDDLLSSGAEKFFSELATIKNLSEEINNYIYEYRGEKPPISHSEAERLYKELRLAIFELTEAIKDSADILYKYRDALHDLEIWIYWYQNEEFISNHYDDETEEEEDK